MLSQDKARMRIETLLNPAPSSLNEDRRSAVTSVPKTSPPPRKVLTPLQPLPYASPKPRGQRLPKDAPIFRKGEPKGAVQFPPHEAGDDEELRKQHQLFQVYPIGEIADYCHHIPYSSDKKTFLSRTGRDAFEVYQYTFKLPSEDKEYAVMWDYNIGLVRITPFFKCCKYSKTTPAKVLNGNPGLRDISHSITGGALAAQGYWMPFECAKAVAATFCYNVRYALTPLFGKDFVDICLQPTHSNYGNFKIDESIIDQCTAEQQLWLQRSDARQTPIPSREASETPGTTRNNTPFPSWSKLKKLKPKLSKDSTPESGYGTDTDWSEGSNYSPQVSPKTQWVCVNRPQTPLQRDCSNDEISAVEGLLNLGSPTPKPSEKPAEIPRSHGGNVIQSPLPHVEGKDTPRAKRPLQDVDEDYGDDEKSCAEEDKSTASPKPLKSKALHSTEAKTAHLLLRLRLDGSCKSDAHREKRPRTMSV